MGNDLKQKILVQNGIISEQEIERKPSILNCPRCSLVNAIENKYCSKCLWYVNPVIDDCPPSYDLVICFSFITLAQLLLKPSISFWKVMAQFDNDFEPKYYVKFDSHSEVHITSW